MSKDKIHLQHKLIYTKHKSHLKPSVKCYGLQIQKVTLWHDDLDKWEKHLLTINMLNDWPISTATNQTPTKLLIVFDSPLTVGYAIYLYGKIANMDTPFPVLHLGCQLTVNSTTTPCQWNESPPPLNPRKSREDSLNPMWVWFLHSTHTLNSSIADNPMQNSTA